jgi:hypothetical protein
MSFIAFILASSASAAVAMLALGQQLADARNVARLAAHFGWTRSDAADAYAVSRRVGFGAAYRSVRAEHRPLSA